MRILKPLPGTLPMPGRPLADAVCLWPMNSLGNKVFDLSGNGNTGTFDVGATSPSWVAGKYGSAINFDGVDDYVNMTGLVNSSTSHTFVFQVKAAIIATADYLFDIQTGRLLLAWVGDDLTNIGIYDGDAWRYYGAKLSANVDYQLVYVMDGVAGKTRLYVNGALYGSEQTYVPRSIGGTVILGARYLMTGFFYRGNVDYTYYYNKVLSASEIALSYREPFCMFPEIIMPEFAITA